MSDGAMSKEDMERVLEDGWVAYQDGNWQGLGEVLHPLVVWHDGHSEGHEAQPFEDHPTKEAVLAHFVDCKEKGPYLVPVRKLVKVLGPDLAVVFDEIELDGHKHGCVDIYRFEDGLIREMWTCVTEPGTEPVHFSATQGGPAAS